MKKSFLIAVIVALVIMISGITICAVASNKAKEQGIDLSDEAENDDGEAVTSYELDDNTEKISLILPDADVEIYGTSDKSYVELVNFHSKTYSFENQNGYIEIDDNLDVTSLFNLTRNNFEFKGIRSIVNLLKTVTDKKTVRVYLKANSNVSVSIGITKGNAVLENVISGGDLYISDESGNVTLSNVYFNSGTVNVTSGIIDVKTSEIKTLSLKLHNGKVKYYTEQFAFHGIEVENESGSISVMNEKYDKVFSSYNELAYINLSIYSLNGDVEISGK